MRLLWDLDGTIFNTYPAQVESFAEVYEEVHGKKVDKEEVLPWLKTTTKQAFEEFDLPLEYIDKYKQLNSERARKGSAVFDGIKETLEAAEVNVIVTHRAHASTRELLEKWDLFHHFDEIVSPVEDGYAKKPDTGAYQYLHDKYTLDWAIGDRKLDLIPAKAVGLKTVAFQNDAIEADLHVTAYTKELIKTLQAK